MTGALKPMRALAFLLLAMVIVGCVGTVPAAGPSGTSPAGPGPAVRVAAAADLRYAMDELISVWASRSPDVTVEVSYGSSGNFLAQIETGAPFDVFFSADAEYPRRLEDVGLAAVDATRIYGIGQIVVWVRDGSPLDDDGLRLERLAEDAVQTVAIANPEHAPYGRAAVAALENAALIDAVRPKFVLGENISQAAQFVESGSADAGIIALSIALAPALADRGRFSIVPIDLYPTLEQGAVVLSPARDPVAARDFLDFVLGPDGREVLDRYGFLLPTP